MESFKIGSININGGRDVRKRMSLNEYIQNKSIDVTFVQETHSDVKMKWNGKWVGEVIYL